MIEVADDQTNQEEAKELTEEETFQQFVDLLTDLELEEMLRLLMPIIKLGPGKYLIGSKIRQIIIKNNQLIARVGGGFMELDQCIAIEAKTECL